MTESSDNLSEVSKAGVFRGAGAEFLALDLPDVKDDQRRIILVVSRPIF